MRGPPAELGAPLFHGSEHPSHVGDGVDLALQSVSSHTIALIAALIPIVLLSKTLAVYVDYSIGTVGALAQVTSPGAGTRAAAEEPTGRAQSQLVIISHYLPKSKR